MRLAIAVPTKDFIPATFAADLAELYAFTLRLLGEASCTLAWKMATYVHEGRETLLQQLIESWGATHVLWLDSDMRFPRDAAIRLLQHNLPIVGCNCTTRVHPARPTSTRNGELVYTTEESTGLEEVDKLGLAVLLMQTSIVKTMEQPWFWYGWNAERRANIGEDIAFCERVREAGYSIYVDHDLSKEVSHTGQHHFGHSDVKVEVFA